MGFGLLGYCGCRGSLPSALPNSIGTGPGGGRGGYGFFGGFGFD